MAPAPVPVGAVLFTRLGDHDLTVGASSVEVWSRTMPSSTVVGSWWVIHNLSNIPRADPMDAPMMPTRRPMREPFHPCPVAVLTDQEA